MSIRYSRPTRDSRVLVRENRALGILEYGDNNRYPQNASDQVDKSGTASICVKQYANFLVGEGFDVVGETVVNSDGQTLDELLAMLADDFATYGGFSVHISFNALGKPTEYTYIDFSQMRLPVDPERDDHYYMVYMPNLGEMFKGVYEDKTIKIPRWDPDKVLSQLEEAKRPDVEFRGQVFWFSNAGPYTYPLPIYGAVIEDMETEYNMMISKKSAVSSGFSARHVMYYNDEFETDQDFDDFSDNIRKYSGPEENGSIIVLETKKEGMIQLEKIEQSDNAEQMFRYIEESTSDSIRESFAIPPVLIGKYPKGTLGSSKEYLDSVAVYNMITRNPRTNLSGQLSKIFGVRLEIQPLQFDDPNTPQNELD